MSPPHSLNPGHDERDRLMQLVFNFAQEYLDGIPTAPAFIDRADRGSGLLDSPITEEGVGLESSLQLLSDHVTTVGLNPTSGRFLGYIPGGGLFYSALGDFLAAVTNRYAGLFFASPGAVRIENQLIRWMADIIGYPTSSAGYLAVGGSVATQAAIVTARDHCGIEGDRIPKSVIYMTVHAHHCIEKAVRISGLRRSVIRRVPVDDRFRMDAAALEQIIADDRAAGLEPWLVVASAGTTNAGSVDPLDAIADIAEREGLWYHIDAAYGGFFVLCPECSDLLAGLPRADSIVIDPHKALFLPYGTGALLVKDGSRLLAAHRGEGDYMRDAEHVRDELSPSDLSPELTKHFRGLRLWLPLKILGVAPFRDALTEKLQLARYFYQEVSGIDGFEVGPEPELSVVMFRYVPKSGDANEFNRRLIRAINADGRVFFSTTTIDGDVVLRMAALCFRTDRSDIETALAVLREIAPRIN